MWGKQTSHRRPKTRAYLAELQVNTPRIVFFQCLKVGGLLIKFSLYAALLVAFGMGGMMAYNKLFVQNDEFALRDIPLLRLGSQEPPQFIDHKRVVEETGIDLSASIFAINREEIEEKINGLPEIAQAKVSRRFPGTMKIEVLEHIPVAWIECEALRLEGRNPRSGLLVNDEGIIFPCSTSALWLYAQDLPVIALPESPSSEQIQIGQKIDHRSFNFALELARHSKKFLQGSAAADRIEVRDEITIELVTVSGSQGIFSYFDQERQLSDFARLIQHAETSGRALGTANLIPTRNIPVTYAGGH